MSSLREQILADLADTLTDATDAQDRVYRTRRLALVQDERPAILVMPESEDVDGSRPGMYSVRTLSVSVLVYARGEIADQAADDLCVQVHALLMADESRGGTAMRTVPGGTSWRFSNDDMDAVEVSTTYQIVYNARRESLDQRP
jgi:hypothetical protein